MNLSKNYLYAICKYIRFINFLKKIKFFVLLNLFNLFVILFLQWCSIKCNTPFSFGKPPFPQKKTLFHRKP